MKPVLFAVAALFALSACTAHTEVRVATAQPAVTTVASTKPSPSPSKETDYDKALRYTRCMTDNGTVMSDPVAGKPLQTGDAAKTSGWQRATNAAFDKCKQYLPATWPVLEDPADVARDAPFFACMRQHGLDVGQVDANGMIEFSPDPTSQDTPAYRAAESACRYLVDDPASTQ